MQIKKKKKNIYIYVYIYIYIHVYIFMFFKHEYACILMNHCSLNIHQLFHLKVKIYTTKMKKQKSKVVFMF